MAVTIETTKSSYIDDNAPDANYGTSTLLYIEDNSFGDVRRSLVEFSLSTLHDVPTHFISNVSLYCYVLDVIGTPTTIDFRKIDNNTWNETAVTWNTAPSSTDYNDESIWTATGWKTVTITDIIKQAIEDEDSVVGILAKFLSESAATIRLAMYSDDNDFYKPYILITYDTYSQTRLKGSLCKNLLDKSGWGEITMTDHNCPTGDAATFTFKTEWGTTYTTVLLDVGETAEYTSGTKHHSFKLYSMTCNSAPCDNLAAATIEERFWDTGNAYVKTDGDNDCNGRSWTEAWETITHAANEVFDGQDVRIGFGTYDSETDVTPDNAGSTGIKYTPETVGTGGGTGSVTINM